MFLQVLISLSGEILKGAGTDMEDITMRPMHMCLNELSRSGWELESCRVMIQSSVDDIGQTGSPRPQMEALPLKTQSRLPEDLTFGEWVVDAMLRTVVAHRRSI